MLPKWRPALESEASLHRSCDLGPVHCSEEHETPTTRSTRRVSEAWIPDNCSLRLS